MELEKVNSCKGIIDIPGDKSISHRGIMFSALAEGTSELDGFLDGADCRSTIACFQKLGIDIVQKENHVIIHGKGLYGLMPPTDILDVGNSGTTMRLLCGILAGNPFSSSITGDASIQMRPMKRILTPLTQMGATVTSINKNDCAPLSVKGGNLHGITYHTPVASAQVKSCILLAGLYANSPTTVIEPALSRNHTELMLSGFGAKITCNGLSSTIEPSPKLTGRHITIPGDISSAAYFIAAGLITGNSHLYIKNININPTRDGILRVAKAMGGNVTLENKRIVSGEEVADIHVTTSELSAITIDKEWIPTLIDEIPVIAVMACFANGRTVIKDAQELKVKESNRIDSVVYNLKNMGAKIEATDDGMIIEGSASLHGTTIKTYKDHRIAMAFAIAGINANGITGFDDSTCIDISYPTFFDTLYKIMNK